MPKSKHCSYCQNRVHNKRILETDINANNGLRIWISQPNQLSVNGWFDKFVGIGQESVTINYCPICGRNLNEAKNDTIETGA